jgi:hypothetical protein
VEIHATHAMATCQSRKLQQTMEAREEEADEMQQATTRTPEVPQPIKEKDELTLRDIMGRRPTEQSQPLNSEDPVADKRLLQVIKENYERDLLTRSMLTKPVNHKKYFHMATNGKIDNIILQDV